MCVRKNICIENDIINIYESPVGVEVSVMAGEGDEYVVRNLWDLSVWHHDIRGHE